MEKWVYLDGHKTRYKINSDGYLFNTSTNRIHVACKAPNGYMRVLLRHNGLRRMASIHRLVATYFIPNPNNFPQVNHKDGNKENNNVNNLEWVSESTNINHSFDMGLNPNCGENSNLAKITDEKAKEVCEYLQEGKYSPLKIAAITGVSYRTVRHIRNRESWIRISKDYTFEKQLDSYNGKHTDLTCEDLNLDRDLVENACQMIDTGLYTLRDISRKLGIQYIKLFGIRHGLYCREISEKYEFLE